MNRSENERWTEVKMKGEQKWKWKVNRSENERGTEVKMKGAQKWR